MKKKVFTVNLYGVSDSYTLCVYTMGVGPVWLGFCCVCNGYRSCMREICLGDCWSRGSAMCEWELLCAREIVWEDLLAIYNDCTVFTMTMFWAVIQHKWCINVYILIFFLCMNCVGWVYAAHDGYGLCGRLVGHLCVVSTGCMWSVYRSCFCERNALSGLGMRWLHLWAIVHKAYAVYINGCTVSDEYTLCGWWIYSEEGMCYVVSTIRVTGIYYDKYIWCGMSLQVNLSTYATYDICMVWRLWFVSDGTGSIYGRHILYDEYLLCRCDAYIYFVRQMSTTRGMGRYCV